jgi:hypothetical protein
LQWFSVGAKSVEVGEVSRVSGDISVDFEILKRLWVSSRLLSPEGKRW